MGELSLINYVISCSLKWLGQSSDASGDRAAPHGQHIPHQRVQMLPGRPGTWGCPVKRKTGIRDIQLMGCRTATDPEK